MPAIFAACLGWVLTTCLLVWALYKRDQSAASERKGARAELASAQADLTSLARSHAEQLERISEAHRQEVATLCQRIQAPEIAVAEHLGQNAPPDPPPLDLENDLALISERERQMREFAEELAAEH